MLAQVGAIAHQYGLITQIFRAPFPDAPDEDMARMFTGILLDGIRNVSFGKGKNLKNLMRYKYVLNNIIKLN